jgi:7-keto-8-aminopelargonate synthetase-like enzyme
MGLLGTVERLSEPIYVTVATVNILGEKAGLKVGENIKITYKGTYEAVGQYGGFIIGTTTDGDYIFNGGDNTFGYTLGTKPESFVGIKKLFKKIFKK